MKNWRKSGKKLLKDTKEHLNELQVRKVLDMGSSSNQRVHIAILDVENDIDPGNFLSLYFSQQIIDHLNNDIATKHIIKIYLIESPSLL